MIRPAANRRSLLRQAPLAVALALALGAAGGVTTAAPTAGGAPTRLAPRPQTNAELARQLARYVPAAQAPTRPAGTITVANCDDAGNGSLRTAMAQAVSGDTIDLSTLQCSTITLTSGALSTAADDLTLSGPGATRLAIDGGGNDRILVHTGTGTLSLDGLTLRHGTYVYDRPLEGGGEANGGCIASTGDLTISASAIEQCSATGVAVMGGALRAAGALHLTNTTIRGTTATATTTLLSSTARGGVAYARTIYLDGSTISSATVSSNTTRAFGEASGGALFGMAGVELKHSTVSGIEVNVTAAKSTYAAGGGIATFGAALISDSTVSDNSVRGIPGAGGAAPYTYRSAIGGGGIYIIGISERTIDSRIVNSTISNNSAVADGDPGEYTYGGGGALASTSPYLLHVTNSTLSGNLSNIGGGGVYLRRFGSIALANATIADNSAPNAGAIENRGTRELVSDSSLIAANHLTGASGGTEIVSSQPISGANNLIASADVALPAGTLTADPQLGPLADNGGPTRTHALLPGSPAIDTGSDTVQLATDQRGEGYVRSAGAAPDIGAFELQMNDSIFADGFDG